MRCQRRFYFRRHGLRRDKSAQRQPPESRESFPVPELQCAPFPPLPMSDVTALIDRWNGGDPEALKQLLAVLYPELRRLADDLLRHERADHTLQPTALVHEAYIRLTGLREMRLDSRRHFYGAAAMSMRRILVDHARQRRAQKRGGPELQRAPLEEALNAPVDLRLDFERLDQALERTRGVCA